MSERNLVQTFNEYFDLLVPAPGSREMQEAFRIRYQVFCEELGYFEPKFPAKGLEMDADDDRSLHCMVRHRPSGAPAGYVRLVCSDGTDPDSRLPLETRFGDSLFHAELHPDRMDRSRICEISRLMVHSTFRRRAGEQGSPLGRNESLLLSSAETRTFPLITVSLFMGVLIVGGAQGMEHGFAMMEPRLARLLQLSGFHFTQVGAVRDYYGPRATYHMDLTQALAVVRSSPLLSGLYDAAHDRLAAACAPPDRG